MPLASEVDVLVLQIDSTLDLQQRLCGSVGTASECGLKPNTFNYSHMRPCSPLDQRSWVRRRPRIRVNIHAMD